MKDSENSKALPKFIRLLVISAIVGGVLGGICAVLGVWWSRAEIDMLPTILCLIAIYGFVVIGAIVLGIGFYNYRQAQRIALLWDGEDEEAAELVQKYVNDALMLDSLMLILSFFFFTLGTGDIIFAINADNMASYIIIVVEFVIVIVLTVLLQQKCVDLLRQINPEKHGSVYDTKFDEVWFASCDEAERYQIGLASYKAYKVTNKFCPFLWLGLFLGDMVFDYGALPGIVVLVIWGVLQMSYMLECKRLAQR